MTVAFDITKVPALLRQHSRWLLWTLDGNGRKVPRAAARPARNIDATKSTHWTTCTTATDAATRNAQHNQGLGFGLGFALGAVDEGPTFAGVDLDKCRDAETGVIEPWAQHIVRQLDSYTEVSPSGTGVKVFVRGSLPADAAQGKVYKVEVYDRGRYFTVTGNHLAGTPATVEEREFQLRDLHAKLWHDDLATVAEVFQFLLGPKVETGWVNIRCPWSDHHSGGDQPRDGGLKVEKGKVVGFNCFHAGCSEKSLGDVRKFFGLKSRGQSGDFIEDRNRILKDEPDNTRRALAKLGCVLRFDKFADRVLLTHEGQTVTVTDAVLRRARFAINEKFKFLPSKELFHDVLDDEARGKSFHPVLDYLTGLCWDGKPRLDSWLITYGGADDTPYVRAVGALPLMAAVRRVRDPGCKFDEMLVLESPQGTNKSTALRTLCPEGDWFSDDLPVGCDSQEVIERTGGKWLIEAAELSGMRQSDIERQKAFLSRRADGPVRRAYGRVAEEVPRQFVCVGTTNSSSYLRDTTGNRRYWPVRVREFDIVGLMNDRDQLWAEAVVREAEPDEDIRLDRKLWTDAGREQEARRQDDPWEETVVCLLTASGLVDGEGNAIFTAKVTAQEVWNALAVGGATPSNNTHSARITEIMTRLGYVKANKKLDGKQTRFWELAPDRFGLVSESAKTKPEHERPAFIPEKVSREA